MKQFKITKQILVFTVFLAFASVVFYILFFNNIKEKNNTISAIANDIDIAIQKETKLKSVKDIIKDTKQGREKIDTYFIKDDEIINFIEEIEKIGRDIGVDVEIISVSISDSKLQQDNISELLNLSLEAQGQWGRVFHFLAFIENLPFKINILTMNLTAIYKGGGKKESSGIWKGFFSINAIKLR
jgi:Tfp pilus assembly protein PilO